MSFLVDIPTLEALNDDDGQWIHVATFPTKQEAVAWIRDNIGPCDDEGRVGLVTESDTEATKPVIFHGRQVEPVVYRYLVVEPPSRQYKKEDVVVIDMWHHPIGHLELADRLNTGMSFDWEELDNEAIASASDPGTEEGRAAASDRIHSQNAKRVVELLNFVASATGKEVSVDSTFQLAASPPSDEDDDDGECTCHNGHKQNDTVCMWCYNRGRRKWDDPDVVEEGEANDS